MITIQLITKNGDAILNFGIDGPNSDTLNIIDNLKKKKIKTVYAETSVSEFSSLLVSELYSWSQKIHKAGIGFNFERLPKNLRELLLLSLKQTNIPPEASVKKVSFLEIIGINGYDLYHRIKKGLSFIRETFSSLLRFVCGKAIYRRKDFWFVFEDCSYKAVGISVLVSFLVGLILAFVGALQLKTFGASIYVASMVALGMTRIMAAIMIGIIMAGRTGSSYAATLGTMVVNEEIDALKTLGIKVTDYLVAPRLVSLVLTIPFLTLLADALGIFGGAVVGICFLDISPASYIEYSINALSLRNIVVGLIHSLVYGIIISICGCYEGLNAGRDADAVGKATTSAVVSSLVWMIVATGILTVIMEGLGI